MPPKRKKYHSAMGEMVRKMMAEQEEEEERTQAAPVSNESEALKGLFRTPRKASLGSVISYTEISRKSKRRNAFDAGSKSSSLISLDLKKKTSRHNPINPKTATSQTLISPATSLGFLHRPSTSDHEKRFRLDDGRQVYAGITHSDLDIQYNRPPLVHLIHVLEWLFLHSTNSHRGIIMILVLLVILVILHLAFAAKYIAKSLAENIENPYVCRTEACKDLAERLNETLSPEKYKPCDDFYHFVCGNVNSKDLEKVEKEQTWDHGFYYGRLHYDFFKNEALGQMLRRTKKFPDRLLLPFYKGCLNEVERDKRGLQPFYELLKTLKLYNIHGELTGINVIESMALILSRSLRRSAIIKDRTVRDSNGDIRIYLLPSDDKIVSSGAVVPTGFLNYKRKVKQAFELLSELQVDSEELEIVARDITCLDLFFIDRVDFNSTNKISEMFSGEHGVEEIICDVGPRFEGTPSANFGIQPNGNFDYDRFVRQLYKITNPTWDSSGPFPIKGNSRIDLGTDHTFMRDFESVFSQSSPLRIMRYLQWRVFFDLSFELTSNSMKFMNEIQRFQNYGLVENCIENLFTWLQFIAPQMYLRGKASNENDQTGEDFDQLMQNIRLIYERVLAKNQFKEFQRVTRPYSEAELTLLKHIIGFSMRSIVVPPIRFNEKNFPRYPELYEGVEFNEGRHLENLMKVGYRVFSWRFSSKFHDAFYSIHPTYNVRVGITAGVARHDTQNNQNVLYLPLASAEAPFFKEGLHLSDLGGAGLAYADYLENSYLVSLEDVEKKQRLELVHALRRDEHLTMFTVEQMTAMMSDFWDKYFKEYLKGRYKELYYAKKWNVAGRLWQNFTSDIVLSKSIDTLIADQSKYHVISLFANDLLDEPYVSEKVKKMRLAGLEKYNLMQIFYISIVNRRCHKMNSRKQSHIVMHGPISHDFRNNWALRNNDNFAETFNCPIGSNMNPKDKIYFWDRDVRIDDFAARDSIHGFYAGDDEKDHDSHHDVDDYKEHNDGNS